jgi:L-aminopeptidase/D-esterase-like protein
MTHQLGFLLTACVALALTPPSAGQKKERARDLGIPFEGTPGPLNAISDVAGVEVGHSTIISGSGALKVGVGPIRTGVTAVLPRGRRNPAPVFAAWFALNGNGEMTGTTWVEESGFLEGPVMITNTHSVGIVRDAVIAWQRKQDMGAQPWSLPVVAETYDGFLNDINGFHVKDTHAMEALNNARSGAVTEGNVGGGTGMVCYQFKGGIGTSSRILTAQAGGHTVGVLVQANFGLRPQLRVAGAPVGVELTRDLPVGSAARTTQDGELGSIIIIVATDAPLLPHQLKRLARRAALGVARTGSVATNGSGDIFIAFSTANAEAAQNEIVKDPSLTSSASTVPNGKMSVIFEATVQATEEAIVNAMLAAETMTGVNDRRVYALPRDRLMAAMRKYGR